VVSQCQTTSIAIISGARKTNHILIQMSVQECPKIQVRLPIGGKNFCAMPYINNDQDLFQISQKLSLLIQENVLPSSLSHDDSS